MRATPTLLLFLALLPSCKSPEPTEPAAMDDAALEAGDAPDAAADSAAETDAEWCPSLDYPPRTDGCPCMPGNPAACTEATDGKVCVYPSTCPSSSIGLICQFVKKFEEPGYWAWVGCKSRCGSTECEPYPVDSGTPWGAPEDAASD